MMKRPLVVYLSFAVILQAQSASEMPTVSVRPLADKWRGIRRPYTPRDVSPPKLRELFPFP